MNDDPAAAVEAAQASTACSFCDQPEAAMNRLVAGHGVQIRGAGGRRRP